MPSSAEQSRADSSPSGPPRSNSALRSSLARPALEVAPDLLGAILTHEDADGTVAVRLTEVEAYTGSTDPGSHAFRGRTARNGVMFGPAGFTYVYFTYGMHFCLNIVCGPDGEAQALLLRAGEIVAGQELAWRRRFGTEMDAAEATRRPTPRAMAQLASGPARLAQALGIDRRHYGLDVCGGSGRSPVGVDRDLDPDATAGRLRLGLAPSSTRQRFQEGSAGPDAVGVGDGGSVDVPRIATGPRVGVAGPGGDGETFPWRLWIAGDPTVSTYRPAVVRARKSAARDVVSGSTSRPLPLA